MVDVHIVNEKKNPILNRRELILSFPYLNKVTPKKEEVIKVVATALSTDEKLIALKKIAPIFGQQQARIYLNLYSDEKNLKRYEFINKKPKKSKEEKPASQQQKK